MELENVLHMNAGNGETSYANNSIPQKTMIQKSKPVLDDTLKDMYNNEAFPTDCFRIADLGCSSGPNTLLVVSEILDTIHDLCRQNNHKTPEFQVFISDLPQTDFNSVFRSLPTFFEKLKKDKGDNFGACFISAVPGSFYGRLFPCKSLHLVHSSCSVQWLSQVPERLENNMGNIYISKASPSNVFEAYLNQFQKDFSTFLRLRSEELITPNGHMVLTIAGRSAADPTVKDCCCLWELLAISLRQLAAQGVVEEAKVDSFNIPLYTPYKDEVEAIVEKEGSFNLDKLQVFEGNADPAGDHDGDHEKYQESGKYKANGYRAITESLLANHFGDSIIHDLFARFAQNVAHHLSVDNIHYFTIVISLTKK